MKFKETFSTKVHYKPVKTYLSHFYRSQDYRLIDKEKTLRIIPYSFFSPFNSREEAAAKMYLEYTFEEQDNETIITFGYHMSLWRKMSTMVMPILGILSVYLLFRFSYGMVSGYDLFSFLAFCAIVLGYSYLQAANFEKHLADKNRKLLKDLEEFTRIHLHRGLIEESFLDVETVHSRQSSILPVSEIVQ